MSIKIDYEKCCWKECKCSSCCCGGDEREGCVEVCAVGAIKREDVVRVDEDLCVSCGACVSACKNGAISLE